MGACTICGCPCGPCGPGPGCPACASGPPTAPPLSGVCWGTFFAFIHRMRTTTPANNPKIIGIATPTPTFAPTLKLLFFFELPPPPLNSLLSPPADDVVVAEFVAGLLFVAAAPVAVSRAEVGGSVLVVSSVNEKKSSKDWRASRWPRGTANLTSMCSTCVRPFSSVTPTATLIVSHPSISQFPIKQQTRSCPCHPVWYGYKGGTSESRCKSFPNTPPMPQLFPRCLSFLSVLQNRLETYKNRVE
jgi:hypothetical protein